MRKLLLFLFVALFAHSAWADDLVHQAEYDKLTQIKDTHQNMIWKAGQVEIAETIQRMNPKLYEEVKDKPEGEQLVAFRNWMAVEMFEYYKDYFMKLLEKKSKETGREIKIIKSEYSERRWLDRGKLDTDECLDAPIGGFFCCDFPDNFIECYVRIQTSNITYICDEPENDIRQLYNVYKHTSSTSEGSYQSIHFELTSSETNYARWHEWRNQESADVRAGMWTCTEDRRHCKIEDPSKWKSSISPGEKFKMDTFSFSSRSTE